MRSRWIPIVLCPLAASACAQVLGLDEPTVDEGSGGSGGAAVVGSTGSSSSGVGSTGVVSSVDSSSGSDRSSSSADSSTGSGGQGPCREHLECDDDNQCTADLCVEGQCFQEPIAPPADDPTDCVDVTCDRGVETQTADDTEDPPDPAPPCRTAICSNGIPTNVDADEGTSCGAPPLECNGEGACIGCTTAADCGEDTECATPVCGGDGVCDTGLVAAGTAVDDATGNCVRLECSGTSGVPTQITDGGDEPADVTCGTGFCRGMIPRQQAANSGTACSVGGFDGVCRGNQMTGDAACVQCVNAQHCDRAPEGQECLGGEGNVCGCNSENDCEEPWRDGGRCLPNAEVDRCGCAIASDCVGNRNGDTCLQDGRCGCAIDSDCVDAALGDECIATKCGCLSEVDCVDSTSGDRCVDGHCGCVAEADCGIGQNCVDGYCFD